MPDPTLVKPHKRPVDYESVAKTIIGHEGYVAQPYLDSKDKWTIGYGTLIGDGSTGAYKASPYYKGNTKIGRSGIAGRADLSGAKIDKNKAYSLLMDALKNKAEIAIDKDQLGERFFDFSPDLQREALSSFYRGGLSGSKEAKRLIREGKFADAAKEFLDHDGYRKSKEKGTGVAPRMEKLADLLKAEDRKKNASFTDRIEQRLSDGI